jgi:hypothetical protein
MTERDAFRTGYVLAVIVQQAAYDDPVAAAYTLNELGITSRDDLPAWDRTEEDSRAIDEIFGEDSK